MDAPLSEVGQYILPIGTFGIDNGLAITRKDAAVTRHHSVPVGQDPYGIAPRPPSGQKTRVIQEGRARSYHNSHILSPHLVHQLLGDRIGNDQGTAGRRISTAIVIQESVRRLRPLQDDIGPVLLMQAHKPPVECAALVFQYACHDLNPRVAQHTHPPAAHFLIRVETADNYTRDTLFNQQFGTRRCLAVMTARLKADIECAVLKGAYAFFLRPPQAIDLRVRSPEDLVPPLGQHFLHALTRTYQDGTHHRIRRHIISPQTG